jgi:hypothetical protein
MPARSRGFNSPSAPERASLLRLTLRAHSRSETGTARFKNSRLDIPTTQKMTNGNQDLKESEKDESQKTVSHATTSQQPKPKRRRSRVREIAAALHSPRHSNGV